MVASSAMAVVKRARFAFTVLHLVSEIASSVRQPGGLGEPEIPGFASPPRDGFALDGPSTEDVRRPRSKR